MGISLPMYYVMIIVALLAVLLISVLFISTIKQKFFALFEGIGEVISGVIKGFLSTITFGLIK
jgi:Flp pilus assembly pilin Flp